MVKKSIKTIVIIHKLAMNVMLYICQSKMKVMAADSAMWYMVRYYSIAFCCRHNFLVSGGLSWGKICFKLLLSFTLPLTAATGSY